MKASIFGANINIYHTDLEEIDLDSAVNPFSQCFSGGSMPLSRSELYNYLAARVPVKLVSDSNLQEEGRYPIACSQSSWTKQLKSRIYSSRLPKIF